MPPLLSGRGTKIRFAPHSLPEGLYNATEGPCLTFEHFKSGAPQDSFTLSGLFAREIKPPR